ncbi:MAG: 2-oxoacid:acceptor oxidoreductase subunit alpha [Bacteroidales bacterium]
MKEQVSFIEKEDLVVKFVGDSGDGMQLAGTIFSHTAALLYLDLATFPDYPAEIRAPHNTVAGVSGFQVHVASKKVGSTGDFVDILVAMNPASLKANKKWLRKGAMIIVDVDTFVDKAFEKAGYQANPLEDGSLSEYQVVRAPITTLCREALVPLGLTNVVADKTRNMFTLGLLYYILNWTLEHTNRYFEQKFKKNEKMVQANKIILEAGYNFGDTMEVLNRTYKIPKAPLPKGKYRNITGNIATAWGLIAASERSGRQLFLGSYPITPATDILIELSKRKSLGVKVFQAEDEIAAICSSIGASYAGALAATSTSGPGLSLKSEALGLAVMAELPLVVIDVQRGGPSTGLPTKSEQSDLMQALFGRNGEAPLVVIAASTPENCFYSAYDAAKIAMEHMTPVILLSDGSLGNGAQLFRIPKVADLPEIVPPLAEPNEENFAPYRRDENTYVRRWAVPGTEGLRHRIGGLEKLNIKGSVSTDPENHQLMVDLRNKKVQKVADFIPEQEIIGDNSGDLLVVSWGGTYGTTLGAVEEMQKQGKKVSLAHFHNIMPLPKNTKDIFGNFKKIIVCELNSGQFANYLRMNFPQVDFMQYNKIMGLPFTITELVAKFNEIVNK